MVYQDKTLTLYRDDLRTPYSKIVLESAHLDMFSSSAQPFIEKAHVVIFYDEGREIILKNKYSATGIITDTGNM
jgi:hypothetical protein